MACMDFFLDVVLRVMAMGVGIAFYSWLLAYDPWDGHRPPTGHGE
jgi:hypothetical protein